MGSRRCHILMLLTAMLCVVAGLVSADEGRQRRLVDRIDMTQRMTLESLAAMSTRSLAELDQLVSEEAIRQRVEAILASGSLSVGAREYDESGRAGIHRYLLNWAKDLEAQGLQTVGSLKGRVAVPVSLENLSDPVSRGEPAFVQVGETKLHVTPLWPNGGMPSLTPAAGIGGPLIYVDSADWDDLKGLRLDGAIAIMDFEGGRHFERLLSLGARAVIVVADDHVVREKAQLLFANTPIPFPRFYVDAAKGRTLIEMATRKVYDREGQASIVHGTPGADEPPTALLKGGNVFENRPFESLFVYLPPTEPMRYTVPEGDLLRRIAASFGTTTQKLVEENTLRSLELSAGQELKLPGSENTYRVKDRDLLERLAAVFGIDAEGIAKANDLKADPAAGDVLIIPNATEPLVLTVAIDAASVAPDAPHGATAATNIALAMSIVEHAATSGSLSRRRGLVVGFLDAEMLAGRTSRLLGGLTADEVAAADETGAEAFPWLRVILSVVIGGIIGAALGWFVFGRRIPPPDSTEIIETTVSVPTPKRERMALAVGLMLAGLMGFFTAFPAMLSGGINTELELEDEIRFRAESMAALQEATATDTDRAAAQLSDEAARWLTERWLYSLIDTRRAVEAERRVDLVNQRNRFDVDDPRWAEANARLDAALERVATLSALRDETVLDKSQASIDRLAAFISRITDPAMRSRYADMGLSLAQVRERLSDELAEYQTQAMLERDNRQLLEALQPLLSPGGKPALGWHLMLSDGSPSIGLLGAASYRSANIGLKSLENYEKRYVDALAWAGYRAGWADQWPLLRDADRVDVPLLETPNPYFYPEFWQHANVALVPIGTRNDLQEKLDTPRDIAENLDLTNLRAQWRSVMVLAKLGLESPLDTLPPATLNPPALGRMVGKVLQFNVRQGLDAEDPVAGAYVHFPSVLKAMPDLDNTAAYMGGRPGIILLAGLDGGYRLPPETLAFAAATRSMPVVYAYRLNRETALFDKVVDSGRVGTQNPSPNYTLSDSSVTVKNLVLMQEAYPLMIFAGPDPMDYQPIGGGKGSQSVRVTDAVLNGDAEHYAFFNPKMQYNEDNLNTNIVFMEPGRRVRLLVEQLKQLRMLLINLPPQEEDDVMARATFGREEMQRIKGRGFVVGPTSEPAAAPGAAPPFSSKDDAGDGVTHEDSDGVTPGVTSGGGGANLALNLTALRVAEDWVALGLARQAMYADKGLRDTAVRDALQRAQEKLEAARVAADEADWLAANGLAREAWGIMVKFYPRIMQLGREAVFSAVLLMALLVPASMFMEKLVIGSKGIIAQLGGTTVLFLLAVALLKFTHPALLIAVSPFIVMIAFIMILMSSVVLVLCYQRFEVLVRRRRMAGGEVESEEISLFSSLATALSLGVSNLKKRPSRTFLTAFTVSVLTFSIITFVSVTGRESLYLRTLTLDSDIEHEKIAPLPPAYEGLIFREFNWHPLPGTFVSAIHSEFGTDFEMTTRGFYLEVEGGNNAAAEGKNRIELASAGKRAIVTGIVTMEPNEPHFSGLNRAVTGQQWFRDADPATGRAADRFVAIIPDQAAAQLGITESDLFDERGELKPHDQLPRILMRGVQFRVIGILSTTDTQLIARDVSDWSRLVSDLRADNPAAKHVMGLMTPSQRRAIERVVAADPAPTAKDKAAALGVFNDLIERRRVYDAQAFADVELPGEAQRLANLSTEQQYPWARQRVNRLALEALSPAGFAPPLVNANRIRDVTGESLTIVDFLRSAFSSNASGELINEGEAYHMDWSRFVIVPRAASADIGAKDRAVAIRFPEPKTVSVAAADTLASIAAEHLGDAKASVSLRQANRDTLPGQSAELEPGMTLRLPRPQVEQLLRDLELRVNRTMFGYFDGGLSLITTRTQSSVSGIAKIIVPVLLCVLIVLNTMMGAVDERKGEVSMLGAVGLSPSQISFLLLSESMVFSVLGIVFGTLAGLVFANLVTGPAGVRLFGELTFNFTSLVSMGLAMGTGLVVLLATIIPARRAARLAAPSGMARWELPPPGDDGRIVFELPFTLTRGNAVGMIAFFRRFLLNHTEATSEDFNCRNVKQRLVREGGDALVLNCDMWLAPYDLDVAQHFELRIVPTEHLGVFAVWILLERASGSEEAWLRTNYGFLNLVRQQFLLWRNLAEENRQDYIQGGADLFRAQPAVA